jgi:methionyl aminopeptidase
MIPIKNSAELDGMRASGRVARAVLEHGASLCVPGATTAEVDLAIGEKITELGGRSAFLGYRGFPGFACISVNEEVIHGIGGPRRLRYGDIVKLDVGVSVNGWIGDNATTVAVGPVAPETARLMQVTEECLYLAIAQARAGNRVRDISQAVESHAVKHGCSVVREFVGHGVGRKLHEEPQVPNFVTREASPKLKPGMTLAIEPMINLGAPGVAVRSDKWTVVTVDGKPSSHFEHTVLVTEGDAEILTCSPATRSK